MEPCPFYSVLQFPHLEFGNSNTFLVYLCKVAGKSKRNNASARSLQSLRCLPMFIVLANIVPRQELIALQEQMKGR